MFWFLANENSWGNFHLRTPKFHMSDQKKMELPLPTLQDAIMRKYSECDITSLHQNEPTGLLIWGTTEFE
jgi:hypothetical protein